MQSRVRRFPPHPANRRNAMWSTVARAKWGATNMLSLTCRTLGRACTIAVVFFALAIGIAGERPAWADCASTHGCWCGDGNCPTLGCCGREGQRVCCVGCATSDCPTACDEAAGYYYDSLTASCQKPCAIRKGCFCGDGNCPTLGCCGGAGERVCLTGPA